MFEMLDDPNPPQPSVGSIAAVRRRARHLQRRRRAMVTTPAVVVAGVASWYVAAREPQHPTEVASVVPTTAPLVMPDTRGEVLELDAVPAGYAFTSEVVEQVPSVGSFQRRLLFESTLIDPTSGEPTSISVARTDMLASFLERQRQQPGDPAVTPNGREVILRSTGGGYTDYAWYVDDNTLVTLAVPDALADQALALFDQILFQPATQPCTVGEQINAEVAGCEAARLRRNADGSVESLVVLPSD